MLPSVRFLPQGRLAKRSERSPVPRVRTSVAAPDLPRERARQSCGSLDRRHRQIGETNADRVPLARIRRFMGSIYEVTGTTFFYRGGRRTCTIPGRPVRVGEGDYLTVNVRCRTGSPYRTSRAASCWPGAEPRGDSRAKAMDYQHLQSALESECVP